MRFLASWTSASGSKISYNPPPPQKKTQLSYLLLWEVFLVTPTVEFSGALAFCSKSVQSLNHVQLFVTPWTAAHQASLSITNSQSLLKLMSIESVMPPNHLILCLPLLLLPSIFPRIRVFFSKSVLPIWWPKYWSFSFSLKLQSETSVWSFSSGFSPSNEHSRLIFL